MRRKSYGGLAAMPSRDEQNDERTGGETDTRETHALMMPDWVAFATSGSDLNSGVVVDDIGEHAMPHSADQAAPTFVGHVEL